MAMREGPVRRRLRELREGKDGSKAQVTGRFSEIAALDAMMKLMTTPPQPVRARDAIGRIPSVQLVYFLLEAMLKATMYALKQTVKDETTWHVFIQDWAASLNRAGLLSSTNEQLFREWAYSYMHAD